MHSLEKLREAKDAIRKLYPDDPNINGVGIGQNCVHLYLIKKSKKQYLTSILGVTVETKVIGKIRPLNEEM